MDIRMPGMNGIECTDRLRRLSPPLKTRVLILTDHSDNESVFGALKAGADGYLLKDHVSTREIYDAIVEVNAGGAPMDRWIARKVIEYFHQPVNRSYGLTAREHEMLELLSRGLMHANRPLVIPDVFCVAWLTCRTPNMSIFIPDPFTAGIYPTSRKGEYFRGEVLLNNSTGAVYAAATNLAVLPNGTNADIITTNIGNVLLPKTPEAFVYDADGNLLSDGVWTNRWDAENRLTSTESTALVPSAARQKVDLKYDYRGRRIHKVVSTWNGSSYVPQSTNRFMYDGWNLLAVFPANNTPLQSFIWGQDLSGTDQGAGGVGGLLAVNAVTNVHFASSDGNGNIVTLVNASNATVSAEYEYSPFGELLRATGPMAKVNPFRFSTKFQDDETDLLYYGYRYYRPSTGRWLSKDPIGEMGGINLYAFALNDPLDKIDRLGLSTSTTPGIPHVSNDRHDNYLIFYISCPTGFKVSNVRADYNDANMWEEMYQWYLSRFPNFPPEQLFSQSDYITSVTSGLNLFGAGGGFGGLQDVGPRNCRGNPVEVHAYLRTRLVSPGFQFGQWRSTYSTPAPSTMVGMYTANTQIHYTCDHCCGRGTSN